MRKIYLTLFLGFQFILNAQSPSVEWQTLYGGTGYDSANTHVITEDGSRVIAGHSSTNSNGSFDFWVFKTDNQGNMVWEKRYGGSEYESALDIKTTLDGGYIVLGITFSNDGDVVGYHGDSDIWVLKIDSEGEIEWQKTLGGQSFDDGRAIIEAADGGFIIAATSGSNDGDLVGNNNGERDCWLIKLTSSGEIAWNHVYGGSYGEMAFTIEKSNDEGYLIGGFTRSNDGDVSGLHGTPGGQPDGWLIKINEEGVLQWQKCLGGTSYESVNHIERTNDGGYILSAEAISTNGDVTGPIQGQTDVWMIKINSEGAIQWQNAFGGSDIDYGYYVIQTSDLGYLLVANCHSSNGDLSSSYGGTEGLVIKTNNIGQLEWKMTLGGSNDEYLYCISTLPNGNIFITGCTTSSDGDVTDVSNEGDAWIIELSMGNLSTQDFNLSIPTVFPNPGSDIINLTNINLSGSESLIITDNLGKIVLRQNSFIETVNISSLQSGIYYINIISGKDEYKLKFIKN